MKASKSLKSIFLCLTLLLAVSAFASSNKGSISLSDTVTIGTQTVKPGAYSVKWDGTGPDIQLTLLKGSDVVASTPARIVDANHAYSVDAAVTTSNPDGTKSLSALELAGKKFSIQIGQEAPSGGTK